MSPADAPRIAERLELQVVSVENPAQLNLILGQAHFIKTVEDLHETLAGAVPGLRFGLAFCESSGPRLVRRSVYCATASPVRVIVGHTPSGRGILGVIDGSAPAGVETDDDVTARRELLRTIGYKL